MSLPGLDELDAKKRGDDGNGWVVWLCDWLCDALARCSARLRMGSDMAVVFDGCGG